MIRMKFRIAVLLIFLAAGANAQNQSPPTDKVEQLPESDFRSPFRYVIIADAARAQKYANRGPYFYIMDVLMDDKAFSEENLVVLFRLLSNRFADRPTLFVNVYTSLNAIRTPEEYDRTDLAGPTEDHYRYKWAFFSRNENGVRFRYGIPNLVKSKEVIIGPFPERNK